MPDAPNKANTKQKSWGVGWFIAVLLLLPLLSAGYKVGVLHDALTDALPDDEYTVAVSMTLDGRAGQGAHLPAGGGQPSEGVGTDAGVVCGLPVLGVERA